MNEQFIEIVRSGILAPSADNEHVCRFECTDTGIRIWPTPIFASATDALPRVLGLLSMGAVVENMRLRAGELGFEVQIEWLTPAGHGPMAELTLKNSPNQPVDALAAAIAARHTNRRMYHGPAPTAQEFQMLDAAAAAIPSAQLIWLEGAARRTALGLIWHAESERFLRQQLHHDIFSSIRFDLSWTDHAQWSLPPGALEIEAPMRPLFKALRQWPLMRPLTWLGVHRLIGLRAGWLPAWQAPALGLLVTSLPVETGAIAVGSALERLWLRATLLNLAVQPLAASAVLMQPSSAANGASDQLRATLMAGWQTVAPGLTPLMVFRIGRAEPPTIRSGRRPLADYLVSMSTA